MCGILGILAFGELSEKKQEKLRQEAMIFLSSELLQLTQSRGKDATGIATMFSNCDYMGLKMGIPSAEFVARFGGTEKDFDGYLNIWRKKTVPAKMIIGHCRKSSVGNPENNANNHPIKVEDIIGVHNGTLTNHNQIFKLLKCHRDGTVDSEAIFRLLHHLTKNGKEPFAPKVIQEVCRRLHGSYACLAFAGNNPYQMIGFRDARPMEILLIKPLKLLLIASDKDFLKHVIFRYNKMANLYQIGSIKFPPLKKTDVELTSLPDDHLYIFDIRQKIKNTSEIEDLFIKERIPRNNKIWDAKLNTSSNFNKTYSGSNNVNCLNQYKEKIKNKSRLGMAWNKEIENYQNIVDLNTSDDYPSVEIDPKSGKIIEAETKKVLIIGKDEDASVQKFGFNRVYKNVDSCVTEQAEIEELSVPTENLPVAVQNKENPTNVLQTIVEPAVVTTLPKVEVILETNPDALEKAETALQKEKKFDDIEELQLALAVEKPEDLRCLSLCSFANRVRRLFYKKGWYDGYISYLHILEENKKIQEDILTPKNLFIRANNKRKIAEKNIRIMKNIIQIFSHITTSYGVTASDGISDVSINNAVKVILSNNNELDVDLIKNVFKPGDFKNIPILRKITSSVKQIQSI